MVFGGLDQFRSEGGFKIVSRMTGVRIHRVEIHRVEASDHLIGKRLARVMAAAIG